jgi:large subunit ribosomal protein L13
MKNEIVIDAKNAILGRLASYAAKQALLGKEIVIVNCDDCVVSGRPRATILDYQETRKRGGSIQRGPFFPKIPERIVKRSVRGMLSYKQGRGKDALKRVICHNKVPDKYTEAKMIKAGKEKKVKTIKLKELSKEI